MDRKTGEEHWVMNWLWNMPPESCRETGLHERGQQSPCPGPSCAGTPTHTGHQLQLVEGTLVVVAEAAIENDGAVGQDSEEVLAVLSAWDDLRQSTVRPHSPMALP